MLQSIFEHKKLVIVLTLWVLITVLLMAGVVLCNNRLSNSARCGGLLSFNFEPGMGGPYVDHFLDYYSLEPEITPQWSNFGQTIVFSHEAEISRSAPISAQLYSISIDGVDLDQLFEGLHDVVISPNVSKDGAQITYAVYRYEGDEKRYSEIETATLDGTNRETLTPLDAMDFSPIWSPDGSQIAFKRDADFCLGHGDDDDGYGLYIMRNDGEDSRKLESAPSPEDLEEYEDSSQTNKRIRSWRLHELGGFSWSADGKEIALVADLVFDGWIDELSYPRREGLYIAPTDGSPARRLKAFEITPSNQYNTSIFGAPIWAQDGLSVVFVRNLDGRVKLLSIDREGGDIRDIVDAGVSVSPYLESSCGPSWSPDGSQIMFSVPGEVGTTFIVDANGSDLRSFEGSSCGSWSPDGSMFASMEGGLHVVTIDTGGKRTLAALSNKEVLLSAEAAITEGVSGPISCSLGRLVENPESNHGLVRDCEVLLRIRDQLTGAGELNWDAQTALSDWEGVHLDPLSAETSDAESPDDKLPLRVRRSSLPEHDLSGTIPAEIGELSALEYLDLSSNKLDGHIPTELSELSAMVELNVNRNGLIGAIPKELGMLSNLKVLRLGGNRISGSIPSGLGNLKQLETLDLSSPTISGTLPPELGSLQQLRILDLRWTGISGPLPAELYDLTELRELDLAYTRIEGAILPQIGNLQQLSRLDISYTNLHGCIPESLDEITRRDGSEVSICEP